MKTIRIDVKEIEDVRITTGMRQDGTAVPMLSGNYRLRDHLGNELAARTVAVECEPGGHLDKCVVELKAALLKQARTAEQLDKPVAATKLATKEAKQSGSKEKNRSAAGRSKK